MRFVVKLRLYCPQNKIENICRFIPGLTGVQSDSKLLQNGEMHHLLLFLILLAAILHHPGSLSSRLLEGAQGPASASNFR